MRCHHRHGEDERVTHGVELHALPSRELDVPQVVRQMRDIMVED